MSSQVNHDAAIAAVLKIGAGARGTDVETQIVDCKEDPTRRAADGSIVAGKSEDDDVAQRFAYEATCMANGDGGVLLVGIDDKASGAAAFIGTKLRAAWLSRRIRELVEPPLGVDIREIHESGARLLSVSVPRNPGVEPHQVKVSKHGGRRIPRRVGDQCQEMSSLGEMIAWSQARVGYDWSAVPTAVGVDSARPAAIESLRRFLRQSGDPGRMELAETADVDLLRQLQLTTTDGKCLNRAGELLCCSAGRPRIVLLRRIADGQASVQRAEYPDRGLIEELEGILEATQILVRSVELQAGEWYSRSTLPVLPDGAIREAIVNAVMHRDWDLGEPIQLEVVGDEFFAFSPGPLLEGITVDRLLTAPSRTRNRTLGDALRSMRLAEREGTGVDRMYVELITLGHRPPLFEERDGGLRVVLSGGDPVPTVVAARTHIPEPLRSSARMAVALHLLRDTPSVTIEELSGAAQEDGAVILGFVEEAVAAGVLKRVDNPRPGGILSWRLSDKMRDAIGPVLPYYSRPLRESIGLIDRLARERGEIRNADIQDLLGVTPARASQLLKAAVEEGTIVLPPGIASTGRGVYYVPLRSRGSRG